MERAVETLRIEGKLPVHRGQNGKRGQDGRISGGGPSEQNLEGWVGFGRAEVNPSRLKGV